MWLLGFISQKINFFNLFYYLFILAIINSFYYIFLILFIMLLYYFNLFLFLFTILLVKKIQFLQNKWNTIES